MIVLGRILAVVSFLTALTGVLFFFLRRRQTPVRKRLLILTAALIAAIILSKLAAWLASGDAAPPATIVTDTMQAFSLDAQYDDLIRPQAIFASAFANGFLTWYTIVLYSIAPIAGGAVIYDVLAGVSPRVTLFFRRRRPIYVFSELNEYSAVLAEDVLRAYDRVVVVFADVGESADEEENELRTRAREMGAICLEEDIPHGRGFRHAARCAFFLMDRDPESGFDDEANLSFLSAMLPGGPGSRSLWNPGRPCDIFVLTNDAGTVENIRSIKEDYDARRSEDDRERSAVQVHVVRDYTQTCCTMLKTTPLFEALPPAGQARALRVVLFGSDLFSREMFKTVFWCGQLPGIQLYITVICGSREDGPEQSFEDFLRRDCPELLESVRWDGPECLRVRPGGSEFAPPYCGLTILRRDLNHINLRELLAEEQRVGFGSEETFRLADCDYFLLLEGSDKEHIERASALRDGLMYHALRAEVKRAARPVIAFAIRDERLTEIVESRFRKDESSLEALYGVTPPRMIPFASLRERFGWETVSMNEEYLARRGRSWQYDPAEHGSADLGGSSDDIYNSWSSVTRLYHLPYKMYSVGCVGGSPEENALRYYRKLRDDETLRYRLSWLEHRRWCAFTRTLGYTRPFEKHGDVTDRFGSIRAESFVPDLLEELRRLERRTDETVRAERERGGTEKELRDAVKKLGREASESFLARYPGGTEIPRVYALKSVKSRLHPCLVECAPSPPGPGDGFDMLDLISATRTLVDGRLNDIKKHDTPLWKYLPALDREKALSALRELSRTERPAWDEFFADEYEAERSALR